MPTAADKKSKHHYNMVYTIIMHWNKEDALCKALGKAYRYINYYAKTKKSALFDMVYT